jgi:hypothetical protein
MRTDFSSEIDGALSGRNTGQKGYWEVARSGNGDMNTDLLDEDALACCEELEGIGESQEEMTLEESAEADRLAGLGQLAGPSFKEFRTPVAGEKPPFAPTNGRVWMRKRTATAMRKPGGRRLAHLRWAQMTPARVNQAARNGELMGLGIFGGTGLWVSLGIGITLGTVLFFVLKKKK